MKRYLLPLALLVWTSPDLILQAQWTSLGSGITATPRLLGGIFPVDENVIWGFTWHPSVFTPTHEFTITTDGGQTWQPGFLNGVDAAQFPVRFFAMDTLTAWLATTDESDPISGHIYKTTDGGSSWVHQTTGFTGTNETPAGIWFWNENEGVAFGATCGSSYNDQIAIYTTDDGGENWSKVVAPYMPTQLPGEAMCVWNFSGFFSVVGDNVWFGTSKNRVFKSDDRGKSWQAYSTPFSNPNAISSIQFKDEQIGLALSLDPFGIARTTDGGENWDLLPGMYPSNFFGRQVEYVSGTDSTWLIVANSSKYMVSYDDGQNWATFNSNIDAFSVEFLDYNIGFTGSFTTFPSTASLFKWEGPTLTPVQEINVNAIGLSPNPATDILSIQLPESITQPTEISLFDAQGRLVDQQSFLSGQMVRVGHLPSGFYTLKLTDGERVYVGKFIKQ